MSKITLDNLSDNLKEYLDNLGLNENQITEIVNIYFNENIGQPNDLNTTDKTIVGAINEVKDSINDIDFDNIELPLYQKKEDNELLTESKEIVEAINEVKDLVDNKDLSAYQTVEDNDLLTNNKTIVEAINEVFQSGNSAKQEMVAALVAKGLKATTDMSFSKLINLIDNLKLPEGTAVDTDVLSGKTFINSTGNIITGTMTNQGSKTITPSTVNQTLPAGYYSSVTIKGDYDLVSSKIKKGVTIFGVTGTY